jgi:hypothetical protein
MWAMGKQVLLPPARQIDGAITKPGAQPIDSPQITNRVITSKTTTEARYRYGNAAGRCGCKCRLVFLEEIMKILSKIIQNETGAMGWILLWALGIPIPILIVLFMVRGCT